MAHLNLKDRMVIIALLLFIPTGSMMWLSEHNRQNDLRRQARIVTYTASVIAWELYDNTLESCKRGNLIRERLAELSVGTKVKAIPQVNCPAVITPPLVPRPRKTTAPTIPSDDQT